jgi:enamine deaminase RidA (YjgF/YER057c/UK114 family)
MPPGVRPFRLPGRFMGLSLIMPFTASVRDRDHVGDRNPPATLLVVKKFPRSGVEVEIETIAAKADQP